MPMAVPTMPFSASGVSSTRPGPNSSSRPSVARKTPPALPMSSPNTMTSGSRRMPSRSPSFTAWTSVRSAMVSSLRGVDGTVALDHALDERRGRAAGHQFDRLDAAAVALHEGAAGDLVGGVVGALDQHVGAQGADELLGCVLGERGHQVDGAQCSQHGGAILERQERPPRTLEPLHRGVVVDSDDEPLPLGLRSLERRDVPAMNQVEHPVGEHDRLAVRAPALDLRDRVGARHRPGRPAHAEAGASGSADSEASSSSGVVTAVPAWRMTRPAAWLARKAANGGSAPQASANA